MAILSRLRLLLGLSIALILVLAIGYFAFDSGGRAVSPSSKFEINEETLGSYEKKANDGDRDAAFAIAQHYAMFRNDLERADHWYSVAALGGHELAKVFYADALTRGGDENLDKARSLADEISTYDPESARSIRKRIHERSHSQ